MFDRSIRGTQPAARSLADALELPPGPELASVLATTDLSALDDFDLVSYLSATERQTAWAQARQLAAIDELSRRRRRGGLLAAQWTAHEVAAELRLTRMGAEQRLALAEALRRLPATRAAFAAGKLDLVKTRTIVYGVAVLDPAGAHQVEERVLDRATDWTGPQLTQAVRRAVLAVDPTAGERRESVEREERAVEMHPMHDGMAALWVYGPATSVQALFEAITAQALRVKDPGDERTLAQRRFDVLADAGYLHLEQALPTRHRRRPHLQVTVAATTLLGLDDQPGELAGYGPITARTAREVAADATWRRLLTDPKSGVVTDYGTTTYRPPQSLVDKVLAKHPTCRGLGCRQPAARTDLDHTIEFPRGPTAEHNLGPLCRRCHRLKHESGWQVTQAPDGAFQYRTTAGHSYVRPPDAVLGRPPDPVPRWSSSAGDVVDVAPF